MATPTAPSHDRVATPIAIVVGIGSVGLGLWAMVDPQGFFDAVATFEPYNQHFLQDIGAFQVGLGAVLLLAAVLRNGLAAALLGVGIGMGMHTASHVVGRDLGGTPTTDIPMFAILTVLLVAAGTRVLGRRV